MAMRCLHLCFKYLKGEIIAIISPEIFILRGMI